MEFRLRIASQKKNNKRGRIEKRETREIAEIAEKLSQVVLQNDIHEDLVDEILLKLPIKSLIRFNAVSKLWHSIISNPSFHRRRPAATYVFGISYSESGIDNFFSIDQKGIYKNFPLPACCNEYLHLHAKLSNSCNGMLLLSFGPHIFLVNPSTHYFDKVLQLDDYNTWCLMGFCYEESIGDYKAVAIYPAYQCVLVAWLKETLWTSLPFPKDFNYVKDPVVVNDRLHWIDNKKPFYGDENAIIYFDPLKNVFRKLQCPLPNTEYQDWIMGMGVLEGCLCIARQRKSGKCVEVVIMKEYGIAESWTTLFVIQQVKLLSNISTMKPLFTTDDGNILILATDGIWRYNLANKCCTKAGKHNYNYWIDAVTIEENLFCPPRSQANHMDLDSVD